MFDTLERYAVREQVQRGAAACEAVARESGALCFGAAARFALTQCRTIDGDPARAKQRSSAQA